MCKMKFSSLEEAKELLKASSITVFVIPCMTLLFSNYPKWWRIPTFYRNLVGDRILEIQVYTLSIIFIIIFVIIGIQALIYINRNNQNEPKS